MNKIILIDDILEDCIIAKKVTEWTELNDKKKLKIIARLMQWNSPIIVEAISNKTEMLLDNYNKIIENNLKNEELLVTLSFEHFSNILPSLIDDLEKYRTRVNISDSLQAYANKLKNG